MQAYMCRSARCLQRLEMLTLLPSSTLTALPRRSESTLSNEGPSRAEAVADAVDDSLFREFKLNEDSVKLP